MNIVWRILFVLYFNPDAQRLLLGKTCEDPLCKDCSENRRNISNSFLGEMTLGPFRKRMFVIRTQQGQ